ncbi:thiol:disulfide interchange protein [Algibacter lectus]|uniref:Thiol:disulfide interchange protein n=1 Tax=Algibacter lectus TaxID=221126 RepID=A0A090WZX3_9FLAO|nr:hypothetical protein [Algibacter lectus]GAL82690.1 thiol:disulfide interchange protein [Algibacter lectus]
MKKIFIFLLPVLFLASCKTNPAKNYILLSGTILNAASKDFRLSGKGTSIIIKLAEDGTFSDTITTGTGKYIFFDPRSRADLFLTNGGEYNLTADNGNFKNTVKLTGTDSEASTYLMTKINNIMKLRGGIMLNLIS